MEIDLQHAEAPAQPIRSQVCIVGAGIAGLVLAQRLCGLGIGVVLLEAGGKAIEDAGQHLFAEALLDGSPHLGTDHGRFRVFGGTSLRWGGQLLPLAENPQPAWPIAPETLAPFYDAAETLLGVDSLPFDASAFFTASGAVEPAMLASLAGIEARISKWTPFARRNLAASLGRELLAHPRAQVYLHAQATEFLLTPGRTSVAAVLVRAGHRRVLRFEADAFVLAAGTVESVRLLLASRSVAPEGVGNEFGQVGRGFHDHLTLPAAEITGAARARLLRDWRPWVLRAKRGGATVHSVKLEASPELRTRLGINAVLAHLTLEEPVGSGLAAVRAMLLTQQHGGLGNALRANATRLPAAVLDALRLAWAARIEQRRYVSAQARVQLYLNAAQDVQTASRIGLSDQLDAFGEPLPVIDWRISAHELETLRLFAEHLRVQFAAMELEGVAWAPELFDRTTPLLRLDDARHAMGGACMGLDPRSSVVDAQLAVHGVDNLYVASPATFPTGEAHLPTLPLMALTLRLAEHLRRTLAE
jgi:choline dehydrogenase-like flavoprotein